MIPENVTALVDGFKPVAKSNGWNSFNGSTGKCWFIANAVANYAASRGTAVEFRCILNRHSQRAPDDQSNYVVLDGWAIDFASRGGLGKGANPWPLVMPADEYEATFGGGRRDVCGRCGSGREHDRGTCAGPFSDAEHRAAARASIEGFLLYRFAAR